MFVWPALISVALSWSIAAIRHAPNLSPIKTILPLASAAPAKIVIIGGGANGLRFAPEFGGMAGALAGGDVGCEGAATLAGVAFVLF